MVLEVVGSVGGGAGNKAAVLAVFWYGGGIGLIVSYFWRVDLIFLIGYF